MTFFIDLVVVPVERREKNSPGTRETDILSNLSPTEKCLSRERNSMSRGRKSNGYGSQQRLAQTRVLCDRFWVEFLSFYRTKSIIDRSFSGCSSFSLSRWAKIVYKHRQRMREEGSQWSMLRMSFSPVLLPFLLLVFIQIAVPAVVIIVEKKTRSSSGRCFEYPRKRSNEWKRGRKQGWICLESNSECIPSLSLEWEEEERDPLYFSCSFPCFYPCILCSGTLLFSSLASLSVLFSRP